jgi:tripartite ATP-independent transporter DctP family solute receptor
MGIQIFQGYNKLSAFEELPFLFPDAAAAHQAYDGKLGDLITQDILEPVGVKVLCYWENGFRHFTNNKRPITTPDDMSGIKFRSAQSPLRIKMFEILGSSAIPMAFPEVFTGLQQGTVDGQENPLPVIESSRFYEVQKYLSLSGHIYSVAMFLMNPARLASFSPEDQKIIADASIVARDLQREINAKEAETALAKMKEAGIEVNTVDRELFVEKVQPVWDIFRADGGDYLIKAALEYVK